jgi:hypothetical protein
MEKQGLGELHKIKWSGENIRSISHILYMLLIRCNANYHATTWCKMQIIIWMANSDSMHFSDKISYKILFISNYSLEVINLARLKHLQECSEKKTETGLYLSPSGVG